jgi:hypothetical protein
MMFEQTRPEPLRENTSAAVSDDGIAPEGSG